MYYEKILNSHCLDVPRPHIPAFHLQPEDENWRVFDSDRALVLSREISTDGMKDYYAKIKYIYNVNITQWYEMKVQKT